MGKYGVYLDGRRARRTENGVVYSQFMALITRKDAMEEAAQQRSQGYRTKIVHHKEGFKDPYGGRDKYHYVLYRARSH